MPEYNQLRAIEKSLEELRNDLCLKIETKDGDVRTLTDLHQRVAKALRALSGQG
ncbi:hypothetical protein ANTHELSMS3_03817 [Antarctobacter heliothermus]|uniref:Uncharacterized protein n=1 Tax=Antarctobacter heliothermus TaxID=74033 RepID=A0A222E8R1_9RHOB|nr:hypothetical protein [Antarctobacter heliothermus]ASP22438.1 hypothetical protein ANTHELSMS3_03817 [Antarctobacter heliothermus]|tara:strand:+ start:1736 stop:1897 length:162 start_codon:yes stop_codon:yes gene_type:complete